MIRPGTINLGDTAALRPAHERPADLGGWVVGAPYLVLPVG